MFTLYVYTALLSTCDVKVLMSYQAGNHPAAPCVASPPAQLLRFRGRVAELPLPSGLARLDAGLAAALVVQALLVIVVQIAVVPAVRRPVPRSRVPEPQRGGGKRSVPLTALGAGRCTKRDCGLVGVDGAHQCAAGCAADREMPRRLRRCLAGMGVLGLLQQGQDDGDLGSLAWLRVELEFAVVGINTLLHADQADSLGILRDIAADAVVQHG
jgi:hypothetical protein